MHLSYRTGLGASVKRMMPRSLLGRSLLIILLPLVLLQAVAFTIFYGTYLDLVSRRLAFAIAGEISQTIELMHRFPGTENRDWILGSAWLRLEVPMRFVPGAVVEVTPRVDQLGPMDNDLAAALQEKVRLTYTMDWTSDPRAVQIRVQLPDGVLEAEAPRKRLYTSTIYLFVLWLAGTGLLLFTIAALFMRNQVRAHPPPGWRGRGVRHGPGPGAHQAGGRRRGTPGRRRVQSHAGAHRAFPRPADGNAGRRVA